MLLMVMVICLSTVHAESGSHLEMPHVVIVSSEPEYKTEQTLPKFAGEYLNGHCRVSIVLADPADENRLSGIDAIASADLLVISVRRRTLPAEQLQVIRSYIAAGRPVLGIRTANHAFHLREKPAPEGRADWPEFDEQVIGGRYTGHWGEGPLTAVSAVNESVAEHPIMQDVNLSEMVGHGSLYKVSPLQKTAVPLLTGTITGETPEPVVWVNSRSDGGTTVYTSLGHPQDFSQPAFNRMLKNAVRWLTRR